MFELQLTRQTEDWDCVPACVAMVSGIPLVKIKELLEKREPLDSSDELALFKKLGISVCRYSDNMLITGRVYLVTVPSLINLGKFHRIVVDTRYDAGVVIYDPQSLKSYVASTELAASNTNYVLFDGGFEITEIISLGSCELFT